MANEKSKHQPADKELEALRAATATPRSKEATEALQKAVQSPRALVVARAASMIKEHSLENFHKDLVSAFARFLQNPVKSDPGCRAKLAILEALDFTVESGIAALAVALFAARTSSANTKEQLPSIPQ